MMLPAFAKECVYYDLKHDDDALVINYQVLSGGDFELDFEIVSPNGQTIIKQENEKYADFLLKTFGLGEYSFCFSNSYNAMKKVEFGIELQKQEDTGKPVDSDSIVSEHAIDEIDRQLTTIGKTLNYLRAREYRNLSTVQSTESRIVWLSIAIMIIMALISVGQTLIVEFLFTSREKNYV